MSSTTDPGDRSSADIEREVEKTRANVASTLDELRDRASPSQLFEQAIDYARGSGGGDFVRNLGSSVRDNPLPLLLIGAGIGWLMLSGKNDRDRPAGYGGVRHAGMGTDPLLLASDERGTGMASRLGDSAAGAADQVRASADAAFRGVGDADGAARDSVAGAVRSAADGLAGAGESARRHSEALVGEAKDGVQWLLREQPLVLGALGVAIGAAVGALLPGTEAEDRVMGESRDSMARQATSLMREGYESVADAAREPLEKARAAVGDHAAQARDATGQAPGEGGGVREGISDAMRQGREALRDVAHTVGEGAREALAGNERPAPGRDDASAGRRADMPATTHPSPGPERTGPL